MAKKITTTDTTIKKPIKKLVKKVNGKSKGNTFERQISKSLSLWWSSNLQDDLFWRTQCSGGRFTVRNKKNIDTYGQEGDITSTHPSSKLFTDMFYVELKNYADLNLWGLITKSNNLIEGWWNTAQDISLPKEKIPVLILKQKNKPVLFLTNEYLSNKLFEYFKLKYDIMIPSSLENIYFFKLEDILNLDINMFRMILEDISNPIIKTIKDKKKK